MDDDDEDDVVDVSTRQKKELKTLDGEARAAMKKAKGIKGKKGKEMLECTEKEYEQKLTELRKKHQQELAVTSSPAFGSDTGTAEPIRTDLEASPSLPINIEPEPVSEKNQKLEKAKRKKEKQKEKERRYKQELAEMNANAGPSLRRIELELLEQQLKPLSLTIIEIPSDGNCLYRAVAAQCGLDYIKVRSLCADHLAANVVDYAPFCEFTETVVSFDQYVERVRGSSDWGGHVELRALSEGLKRCIIVYSANQSVLVLGEDQKNNDNVIRLSYHLHYYSLGEHYNQVIQKSAIIEE